MYTIYKDNIYNKGGIIMNNKRVRTRFAPSPTGYMHVGNLRTALYAFLIAKKHNGDFILRIEDTDKDRYIDGATDIIYKTLKIAELNWDEGPDIGGDYFPYIQSQRLEIYTKHALELIEKGAAYYCFCDKYRLEELKKIQQASGITPKYDGHCANLSSEDIQAKLNSNLPYVIRQKLPKVGSTSFYDDVYGKITIENSILDDQILIKSDGMPTYNFANVIDDHLMNITHVVRGSEYLSSTPKYDLLYESFGWEKPIYIHCASVMKNQTEKLSKRNGDASFNDLLDKGYLPSAIINYICLLGWAPKGEREIFSLHELITEFSISGISKSPAIFDIVKLKAINAEYIRNLSFECFKNIALPYINQTCKSENIDLNLLLKVLQTRTELLTDIPNNVDFIDKLHSYNSDLFINKKMKSDKRTALDALIHVVFEFKKLNIWNFDSIHETVFNLIKNLSVKNAYVLWPIRVALSGKQFTPGGGIELSAILGKTETINRIEKAIDLLS